MFVAESFLAFAIVAGPVLVLAAIEARKDIRNHGAERAPFVGKGR